MRDGRRRVAVDLTELSGGKGDDRAKAVRGAHDERQTVGRPETSLDLDQIIQGVVSP